MSVTVGGETPELARTRPNLVASHRERGELRPAFGRVPPPSWTSPPGPPGPLSHRTPPIGKGETAGLPTLGGLSAAAPAPFTSNRRCWATIRTAGRSNLVDAGQGAPGRSGQVTSTRAQHWRKGPVSRSGTYSVAPTRGTFSRDTYSGGLLRACSPQAWRERWGSVESRPGGTRLENREGWSTERGAEPAKVSTLLR